MNEVVKLWQMKVLDNALGSWTLGFVTALITLTILPLVTRYISKQRRGWSDKRQQVHYTIDLASLLVERTNRLFPWALALWLGSRYLVLPYHTERVLTWGIVLVFWAQLALWSMAGVRFLIELRRKRSAGFDALLSGSMDVIVFVTGIVIWTMALMLALENLGIEIRPLVAGLGITGIAVALAVQTVLGDVFASMSIALDRPFAVGDFLVLGDNHMGTVEHIGVKSTRLRALSGEQIVMSNTDILKAQVHNYGRMSERRILFQFGVAYETPTATLAAIQPVVREIITSIADTRFDRCHFMSYGDSALQFEVVYYVLSADYNRYADIQHRINMELLDRLRKMDVSFAYPTRTVYLESSPSLIPVPARVETHA